MRLALPPALAGIQQRSSRPDLTTWMATGFTALAALFFVTMFATLAFQSLPVWRQEGLGYVTGTTWFYRAQIFGALPMIYGSAVVSAVALLAAAPVAFGAALFIAEFAPPPLRLMVKVPVELLAGVPSVVYALLGILLLRPSSSRRRWQGSMRR